MNRDTLLALLIKHHIPIDRWGVGEAKTLEHLFYELASGEATIEELEHGLLRTAFGATVDVYYVLDGRILLLRETKQVFADGRERTRKLETSIGEKMRVSEDPLSAAKRALKEELGIDVPVEIRFAAELIKGPLPSQSFPGLMTCYSMHHFTVYLTSEHFRPEGYIEVQADKTNYYHWSAVPCWQAS